MIIKTVLKKIRLLFGFVLLYGLIHVATTAVFETKELHAFLPGTMESTEQTSAKQLDPIGTFGLPVAVDDGVSSSLSIASGLAIEIDVLANDSDPDGDELMITAVSPPDHGTATFTPSSVTYTSTANYVGADSFTYTISDGHEGTATATVFVDVQASSFTLHTFTPTADAYVSANEPNRNYGSDALLRISQGAYTSYLQFDVPELEGHIAAASLRLRASGNADHGGTLYHTATNWEEDTLTYHTAPASIGDALDSAGAVVSDEWVSFDAREDITGNGPIGFALLDSTSNPVSYSSKEGTATPELIITTVENRPPKAMEDDNVSLGNILIPSGQKTLINVLANDSDPDGDELVITAVETPPWGSATFTDSQITFQAWAGNYGHTSFTYTISDGKGGTATATIYATVTEVNQRVKANDDTISVTVGDIRTLGVVLNDRINNNQSIPLDANIQLTLMTPPQSGGSYVLEVGRDRIFYAACQPGTISFMYILTDEHGNRDTALATITVEEEPAYAATQASPAPNWEAIGGNACEQMGDSVAPAGDVNGDGLNDVLVGSFSFARDGGYGSAALYLGTPTGLADEPAWQVVDSQLGSWYGYAVSGAGDVNGDGFDDFIVGARHYQVNGVEVGRVFVYHGSDTTIAPLRTEPAWIMDGEQFMSKFGHAVGAAGDVDGDGIDDILVGARGYDDADKENAGKVYLFYGQQDDGLIARQGHPWTAAGAEAGDLFGYGVGTAGYLNELPTDANRYSDIAIGAWYGSSSNSGSVSVFYGGAAGPSNTPDWVYEREQANAKLGGDHSSISIVGDVNGDGYEDLVVGSGNYSVPDTSTGRVDLFYGSSTGLDETPAWTLFGETVSGNLGTSLGTVGDVNDDGFADFLIGNDEHDYEGNTNTGRIYLFLGSDQGPAETASWTGDGLQEYSHFGHVLSGIGDVNNNGRPDIVVGQPKYDSDGFINRGRVVVYYDVGDPFRPTFQLYLPLSRGP
ncbi:MAG: Ig-like domain-containing protein [Chloroflexota bacterium]